MQQGELNSGCLSPTLSLISGVNPRPTPATPPPICYSLILDLPNRAICPGAHHGPSYPSGPIVFLSLELPTTHNWCLSRSSLAWNPWTLTCGIVLLQQIPSAFPCDLHRPARAGRLSPVLIPPAPSQTPDLDPVVPDVIIFVVWYSAFLCSLQHNQVEKEVACMVSSRVLSRGDGSGRDGRSPLFLLDGSVDAHARTLDPGTLLTSRQTLPPPRLARPMPSHATTVFPPC